MTPFRFLHLDVFTGEPFEGNPLAVFPDGRGLTGRLMQRIAREMACPETTFVLPADAAGTDARVRIFTPRAELPMAGHPTVGTAFALAHDGIIARGQAGVVFGEGVGPIEIDMEWRHGQLAFAWMRQPLPVFGPPIDGAVEIGRVAAAVGLEADDLRASGLPVEEGSSGAPFLFVPVATRAAVDRAEPGLRAMRVLLETLGSAAHGVYLFSAEPGADGATTYSRMFAPDLGISEDPATGSASGPLGAYLVRHAVVSAERAGRILNLQGVRMQRPSWMHVRVELAGSAVAGVRVGGAAVLVAEGTLHGRGTI